jgi:hypothetical protein
VTDPGPVAGPDSASDDRSVRPPSRGSAEPAGSSAARKGIPGRAREFRRVRSERRRARLVILEDVIVAGILALAVYTVLTARPVSPTSTNPFASGPPIHVAFGTPSVGLVSCAGGVTAYAERVPWVNSSQPLLTVDVDLHVYQLGDGDIVADSGVVPNVTATNVCAGPPPTTYQRWYIVLQDTNGTNLLAYTFSQRWEHVTANINTTMIQDDDSIIIVENPLLAGVGYGLRVVGFSSGSPISGSTPI